MFRPIATFHIARVCYFDFIAMINLRIYEGFDRKIVRGATLHPQSLFTVKSLINVQICDPRGIEIVNTKVLKNCN